jgi:hypothetical protein
MINKTLLGLLATTTLSLAATQQISVSNGWTLGGSSLDNVNISKDMSNTTTVWAWDAISQKWKVSSPDGTLAAAIASNVASGKMSKLDTLNAGDGFWVNSSSSQTITLNGLESQNKSISIGNGWNLLSLSSDVNRKIDDIFEGQDALVWQFLDGKWKAGSTSPSLKIAISSTLGADNLIDAIQANQGVWVKTSSEGSLDVTPPEADTGKLVVTAQILGGGSQVILIGGVELKDAAGTVVGTTNNYGQFDYSDTDLTEGSVVSATKDGYALAKGKIKNGILQLSMTEINTKDELAFNPSGPGTLRPLKKKVIFNSDYSTTEMEGTPSSSLTISITSYETPTAVPQITGTIKHGNKTIQAHELSVLGGATIVLKGADKKVIEDPSTHDGELKYKFKLERFIGDLDSIINGLTGSSNDSTAKINAKTVELLNAAKTNGLMDFMLIQQQKDGSWKSIADSKFVLERNKYKMTTVKDESLSTFGSGTLAYVLWTKAVTGETKVCIDEAGIRMNDGSIVTKMENDANANLDFINNPIKNVILFGDENVLEAPRPTDANGCTVVKYKVPYLSPMYSLNAMKQGYFDKPITVDVEFGNLNADHYDNNIGMNRKPAKSSIEGYVRNKVNSNGIENAIISLQDPQILTKEKISINNDGGDKTIVLQDNPNVTYTWTLIKDDSSVKKLGRVINGEIETTDGTTIEHVIKTATSKDGGNTLKQSEIEAIIYANNATDNPWFEKPYGHYYIAIKAVHEYAQKNVTFTEEILADFTAKVDELAIMNAMSYSLNQGDGPIYKKASGEDKFSKLNPSDIDTTLDNNEIGKLSIFGGKDISLFKPLFKAVEGGAGYISAPDSSAWKTYILAAGDTNGAISDATIADDVYLQELIGIYGGDKSAMTEVIPNSSFANQYMPFALVYKMFNEQFPALVKVDYTAEEAEANDIATGDKIPFYRSGFTIFNTYSATFNRGTVFKEHAGSYTDLNWNALKSVNDFSNLTNFGVSANDPIAFSARYTTSDSEGHYRINEIDPTVITNLELMARAEQYKYNTSNYRAASYPSAVNGNEIDESKAYATKKGDVLTHNFNLDPVKVDDKGVPYSEINEGFEAGTTNWSVEKLVINGELDASDTVKWQRVTNASLPTVSTDAMIDMGYGSESTTILPTPYGDSYMWMGDKDTGTYSDTGTLDGNKTVATALKSPLIDFTDLSLGVLEFKTWFETSGYDQSWDTAFVGFEIVDANGNTTVDLKDAMGSSMTATVGQTYITRLTASDIDASENTANKLNNVNFSNNGQNTEASWQDFKVKLDFLAGQKARIVFGFFTADNLWNNFRGWGVDDITINDDVKDVIELPTPSFDADDVLTPRDLAFFKLSDDKIATMMFLIKYYKNDSYVLEYDGKKYLMTFPENNYQVFNLAEATTTNADTAQFNTHVSDSINTTNTSYTNTHGNTIIALPDTEGKEVKIHFVSK